MRKKRIMIVGPKNSGKTTLVNQINNYKGKLKKTPDVIYGEKTIDVPSAYIENSWMYKHLIALSQDASYIILLVDQTSKEKIYSPGFAKAFSCKVIGAITKIDLMKENEDIAINLLKEAGVLEPYFKISTELGIGIEELKKHLFLKEEGKGGLI